MKSKEITPSDALMANRVKFIIDLLYRGRPTEFARAIGVTYPTVWRWTVAGCKPRTAARRKLGALKAHGINPAWLYDSTVTGWVLNPTIKQR